MLMLYPLITTIILFLSPERSQALNQTKNDHSSLGSNSAAVTYHGGRILTEPTGINVYIIWYGAFSIEDRTSIIDFFNSFTQKDHLKEPTVATWWKTTASYKDKANKPVSRIVKLGKQTGDVYSVGKKLHRSDIAQIMNNQITKKKLPADRNGIYLVLTAKDVTVDKFCMNSCGFHSQNKRLVYAHVGYSSQCPGLCAWPYAVPAYAPPGKPPVAPNGVAADGMIINIATVLAGAATNPFKNGYFQGDASAPLEAVSACPGTFGPGAHPGYPGRLLQDKKSKASYNAYGVNGRKYLLPAIWDISSSSCKVV
ncbi:protein EXORDIUM-like 2 [Mercurialis annua]|uniref:protein EXORDIUM-like 2 n=1 Tax=Mercurialis annua TaxID=3986 RepID=UPI00215FEFC9|nr:protein EXORDIUM-like 2 [Mercurialis annua]